MLQMIYMSVIVQQKVDIYPKSIVFRVETAIEFLRRKAKEGYLNVKQVNFAGNLISLISR